MIRNLAALAAAALLLVLASAPAEAQRRPDSLAMTCGQAQALVLRQGGVVLGTGPNLYDRYVSDRRFCEATQGLKRSFVATRDNPACFIGYRCYEPGRSDGFFDD